MKQDINKQMILINECCCCCSKLGKIKYALDDLNAVIDLEPQLLDAYWHRHLILSLLNRKQLAIDDLTFILQHNKKHSSAYKARYATECAIKCVTCRREQKFCFVFLCMWLTLNERCICLLYMKILQI